VPGLWFSDYDFAVAVSPVIDSIFGFGVTADRGRGLNFYASSFVLGDGWGYLCVGGQRDTFLVQITGRGSLAACPGWERRLHDYLSTLDSARLTRVDLAHDDYSGESYSPERALQDYKDGGFNSGGRRPSCRQDGNWIFPDGKGLTFYVGKRENGKLLRVYEKGKQLGGQESTIYSNWTRVELELHNEGRSVPFDVLINPGPYLAGSYPALEWINEESCRIATKTKSLQVSFDNAVSIVKKQFGRYINAMMDVYGSADLVVQKITRPGIPDKLIMPDWSEAPPPLMAQPTISADLAFSF
jgi:phage replication initiation protein